MTKQELRKQIAYENWADGLLPKPTMVEFRKLSKENLIPQNCFDFADRILKLYNKWVKTHRHITELGSMYYLIPSEEVKDGQR